MSYYLRNGNTFSTTNKNELEIYERLPVGNYIIKFDQLRGKYFFELVDEFEWSGKVYGDHMNSVNRILATYQKRGNNTGVLLSGEKGSGKTLIAKLLSIEAAKLNMPTITINTPHYGDGFNQFLQSLDHECVIIFDEYEKVYDEDQQQILLTLFDGVFPSKKLFVFTCNDKYRINSHMTNRPGRIYYHLEFNGLDIEFIREYCNMNLIDKSHTESICRVSTMFWKFNFDMLKAMVEEINRYGENAIEVLKYLNVKPDGGNLGKYEVELKIDNVNIESVYPSEWSGNPMQSAEIIIEQYDDSDDKDDEAHTIYHKFSVDDIFRIDPDAGSIEYRRDNKHLVFTKKKYHAVDYGYCL
jgi:hypothetical protein